MQMQMQMQDADADADADASACGCHGGAQWDGLARHACVQRARPAVISCWASWPGWGRHRQSAVCSCRRADGPRPAASTRLLPGGTPALALGCIFSVRRASAETWIAPGRPPVLPWRPVIARMVRLPRPRTCFWSSPRSPSPALCAATCAPACAWPAAPLGDSGRSSAVEQSCWHARALHSRRGRAPDMPCCWQAVRPCCLQPGQAAMMHQEPCRSSRHGRAVLQVHWRRPGRTISRETCSARAASWLRRCWPLVYTSRSAGAICARSAACQHLLAPPVAQPAGELAGTLGSALHVRIWTLHGHARLVTAAVSSLSMQCRGSAAHTGQAEGPGQEPGRQPQRVPGQSPPRHAGAASAAGRRGRWSALQPSCWPG